MAFTWSLDTFESVYDLIQSSSDIDTIDFTIIKDDLFHILVTPLPSSQLKETVQFSNGNEVKLNQPFIELATILSTELNLEELSCAELIFYSKGTSFNKGTSVIDSSRLNFYTRYEYILNILGYLITEDKLSLVTKDNNLLFSSIIKSFEKIYKLIEILNDLIDKQKITNDINNLPFINYITYAKSQLFKNHELLSSILYNFIKIHKISLNDYQQVLNLIEKNITDEDVLIVHFIPFGMEFIELVDQQTFYKYIIGKIDSNKNLITESEIDLSKLKISGYETLIGFVFLTQFISWCKEQDNIDIDFRSEILKYLEILISFGVMERLLCYCSETSNDNNYIYDFRGLLQRNMPRLSPVKFVYPNSQELLKLNLSNVSKLADVSYLKLNSELNEDLIAPFFQNFFSSFTINAAYVLTSLRDSEEDFVLSSDNDLEEISQRGDLERYYLAFAYTFQNRPKLCDLFWSDDNTDILGFVLWGLSNNTAPLITATFCLLLSSLSITRADQMYELLMNNNHHGLKKIDYSKISIDSLYDSLNYYIESIIEHFELDLSEQIKNQQKRSELWMNNEENESKIPKIEIEFAEDSILFICGFFNLLSSIMKYSNYDIKFKLFNRFLPIVKTFLKFDNLIQGGGQINVGTGSKFIEIPNIIISNESRNILINLILNYLNSTVSKVEDPILKYEVWKLIDCWIYFGFKDKKYKIKTFTKPFSMNLIEINQILNFTKLINTLLKPGKSAIGRTLPFPCDLGMGYRNVTGIWQYIEFLMLEIFANSNELSEEKFNLQNELLDLFVASLTDTDWTFLNSIPKYIKDYKIKLDSLLPNVELTFDSFVKLHPSLAVINYFFENQSFKSLFHIIGSGDQALLPKALEIINLVIDNQDIYIRTLLPILKTPGPFSNLPKNVGTHGVSNFFEILLFNLPTVAQFALYVGHPDPISSSSIKILNRLSQSKYFQRKIQYDTLLEKDRLLTTFESIDESKKIKYAFIDKFEQGDLQIAIVKFLINNLDPNVITVSHFLLGYQIRGDKLDLKLDVKDNLLFRNLLAIDIESTKLSSLILELFIKLCQDPVSSSVTLNELRKYELFEKLINQPKLNLDTLWNGVEFDGDLQVQTENHFLNEESIEIFFNFINQRNLTLQYLSLEFHSIKSMSKKNYYISLLIENKEFLNKQPKVLNFLDIFNYSFSNFEIQKYQYLNNEFNVESILNNLQFEKSLDVNFNFQFDLIEKIKSLMPINGLDEFVTKYLLVEDLNKLQLNCLHSWCQLIEIIIDESVELPILEIFQVIIPKINDYYDTNILFSEELMSLCVLLFDSYKGDIVKLSQLFQTCITGVINSNSTPNLRSHIYILLNKLLNKDDFQIENNKFINILANDSIYSEGSPRITSLLLLQHLINHQEVLDNLIKNNSLLLLIRSLKRINEILTNNQISSLNYLIIELTAFKIMLYSFIKMSNSKLGSLTLIQNEIFQILSNCVLLKIDPDLGLDLTINNEEKIKISASFTKGSTIYHISLYEFLIPIFQLISSILITMGPKYKPSLYQGKQLMTEKTILVTNLLKKGILHEDPQLNKLTDLFALIYSITDNV